MADIILTTSKQFIVSKVYNSVVTFKVYLKIISYDSTNMTIAAKMTYTSSSSGQYSNYEMKARVQLNGTGSYGTAYTPGTWGTTEKNCLADVKTNSTDSNGWKNITVARAGKITVSYINTRTDGGGTYVEGSTTVYFPNNTWVNIGGTWKRGWICGNIDGTWKWATALKMNINGTWKDAKVSGDGV